MKRKPEAGKTRYGWLSKIFKPFCLRTQAPASVLDATRASTAAAPTSTGTADTKLLPTSNLTRASAARKPETGGAPIAVHLDLTPAAAQHATADLVNPAAPPSQRTELVRSSRPLRLSPSNKSTKTALQLAALGLVGPGREQLPTATWSTSRTSRLTAQGSACHSFQTYTITPQPSVTSPVDTECLEPVVDLHRCNGSLGSHISFLTILTQTEAGATPHVCTPPPALSPTACQR